MTDPDWFAKCRACEEVRDRMAREIEILQGQLVNIRINNKGTHKKLNDCKIDRERLRMENDTLRRRLERTERALQSIGPQRNTP